MNAAFIKVVLNGQETPEFLLTLDVTIDHRLNRHSTSSVTFREPPGSRFSFEPLIGKPMEMKAIDGAGAELELFKGVLQEASADWELNGSAVLTLKGISKSYQLDTLENSQTFNEVGLMDAVKRLLADHAGTIVVSETDPVSMIQFAETDWSCVHRLLDRFGGFLRIKSESVEVLDQFQNQGVQLAWRSENGLQRFRTSGRLEPHQLFGVNFDTSVATSRQTVKRVEQPAAQDSISELRGGAIDGSKALDLQSALWNRYLSPTHDRFSAQLSRESERRVLSMCRGFGESRIPEVTAGDVVEITGDIDVPGKYGVIAVTHSWKPGRGYKNEFESSPFMKHLDPVGPKTERYYGPEQARVIKTSPGDESNRHAQVAVQFLWDSEHNKTNFMPIMTPDAGADRGICFVPEVGDYVLVAFRAGDPSKPFILGSLWNGVDRAPLEDLHGGEYMPNDVKRIVTKSGNRLVFDDKEGKETMVMATPKHVRVSLFDGGQTLLLHSDGDIHINAGGTVHMKCAQFLREVG